jgi:LPS-assembly protein
VNSGRVSAGGEWTMNEVVGPGIIFSPFAQARADVYRVENYPTPSDSDTFGRGVGMVGFEARMPFVRAGDNVSWMIEPIMMAALGSWGGNDDRIPNEDSVSFEIDDSDLFRPNGAPNYDLWEPGPRASIGVRATAVTDQGSASAVLGRRFRTEEVPEFAEVTNLRDQDSDWVASLSADLGPKLGGGLRLRLSDEDLNITRLDASIRSQLGPISAAARYFSVEDSLAPGDPTEEIAGTIGVGFAKNWRISYGLRRDLDSAINLSQSTRLSFRDDCTFLEFVYSRTETEDRSLGPSEGFQIRVGLSTLGVFGGS